ncbi:MAG: AAA family ATPase [Bacteroidales bacterium]|nr:AAA family ATPase [Bacteroidales bacterium]
MALTNEQQNVVNAILKGFAPITFIQGKAGTGKSYVIRELKKQFKDTDLAIWTPTGMASSPYRGKASTFHSVLWGDLDDLELGYQNPNGYSQKRIGRCFPLLQSLKYVVIDEISMVRADMLEMINKICQIARNNLNVPFGGLQMILVGDLFQLPPIVEDAPTMRYLLKEYGGVYFFDSHIIQKNIQNIRFFELQQSKRHQGDPQFEKILDSLRNIVDPNAITPILDELNKHVVTRGAVPSNALALAASNVEVQSVNKFKLQALNGSEQNIPAKIELKERSSRQYWKFDFSNNITIDNVRYCDFRLPSQYEGVFTFKIGARVMFTENDRNKPRRYVNGDIGTIQNCNGAWFTIKVDDKTDEKGNIIVVGDTVLIERSNKKAFEMEYDETKHKLSPRFPEAQRTTQFPLKLAYAFTIHKSQGQTYKRPIYIDLNNSMLQNGQLYVALSRLTSLKDLYLTRPITCSDFLTEQSVVLFLEMLRNQHQSNIIPNCNSSAITNQNPNLGQDTTSQASSISPTSISRRIPLWLQASSREFGGLLEKDKEVNRDYVGEYLYMETLIDYSQRLYERGKYKYVFCELLKLMDALERNFSIEQYSQEKQRISSTIIDDRIVSKQCDETMESLLKMFINVHTNPKSFNIDRKIIWCEN